MTAQADYQAFMTRANAIQAQLAETHERLLEAEITGTSGPVTVTISAGGELRDVSINGSPPPSIESIRTNILAAHQHAVARAREMANELMRPFQDMLGEVERGGPPPR